jgi:hypothetical protein
MNKKGDKMLSVYWFAILVIAAGAVFAMVYIFYGSPYDIREIEDELLINQVADCVSYAGRFRADLVYEGRFSEDFKEKILKECHLNFKSSEWETEQYYIELNFYKVENLNNPPFKMSAGNSNWKAYCAIQEDKEEKKLAKCAEKSFYSLDDAGNQYIIQILAAVSKGEKNVKM